MARRESPQISELARATGLASREGPQSMAYLLFLGHAVLADAKAVAWFGSGEARGIRLMLA